MSIPHTLREELKARRVVPFVGAGASMAVKDRNGQPIFPGWRQLLESCAERMEQEGKKGDADYVRTALSLPSPKYLEAAKHAQDILGTQLSDVIEEQINVRHEDLDLETLHLAKAIWYLGSKLIVTTNYDRILEWACEDPNVGYWNTQAPHEQAAHLRAGVRTPTVWHLHGHIHDKANLVLTPESFKDLYLGDSKDRYSAALETLRSLLTSHTFLFIGFSLDDECFGAHIHDIERIFKGGKRKHYILVKETDKERIDKLGLPVEVVTYEEHGEPLLLLLQECAEVVPAESELTSSNNFGPEKYVFHVPFRPKGVQVIGREDALQELRQQLLSGKRTSIGQTASFHGLGGLGKTQLAIEYAYRFKEEYPNGVIWITADQDIEAQLTEIAVTAGWVSPETEHKYKLDIARQRLRSYENCLIIFDNLEDIEVIRPYLPLIDVSPHILVTSRENHIGFKSIPLELLNAEESRQLLLQESENIPSSAEEEESLNYVVSELGGLPLALELAGAFIQYRSSNWKTYRQLLEKNLRRATEVPFDSFTRHESDLYSTLQISQQVFEDEPILREIVDILTWSAAAPMGIKLLASLLEQNDISEMEVALNLGVKLHLLRASSDNSYSLHRLIGRVNREKNDLRERTEWGNHICQRLGDWFQERRQDYNFLPEYELEIDHLRSWQEHVYNLFPAAASRLLWLQAYPPYHRGNYNLAKILVENALKLLEENELQILDLQAHIYHDLSFLCSNCGQTGLQFSYAKDAVEIRQAIYGDQNGDTASSLNTLGGAYGDLGNYAKQLEYSLKAFEIHKEILGQQHPDTASSINTVGGAYGKLGEFAKQLEWCLKSFEIRKEILGEQHPDTASSINTVGGAYGNLGEFAKQLEWCLKAFEIRKEILGEQHPDTASSINTVGGAYGNLGEFAKQLEWCLKSFKIRKEILGEQHPDTASSINNVGHAYGNLGEFAKQLEWSLKAFEIIKNILGEQCPETATAINNVGGAYGNLGEHSKQLEWYLKSFEITKNIFGEQHPDTAIFTNNVGRAYGDLGELSKQLEWCLKAFEISKEILGEQHPITASYINNVGSAYGDLGNYAQELEWHLKAFGIRKDILGAHHPKTLNSLRKVSTALVNRRLVHKAFQLFDEILAKLPRHHPEFSALEQKAINLHNRKDWYGFRKPALAVVRRKWGRS